MSGFSADWLSLREPLDHAARDAALVERLVTALRGRGEVRITELACGTGSSVRALANLLPARWRLVDYDPKLLEAAHRACAGVTHEIVQCDLARDLPAALSAPADLVNTSAFLDLVSAGWIATLARECAARRLPFYAALSVDGRAALTPPDADDDAVLDAFHRHMQRDKGLGTALGPRAAEATAEAFRRHGYEVHVARSDWQVDGRHVDLQCGLMDGWAAAAADQDPALRHTAAAWLERRTTLARSGGLHLMVGHLDLMALPRP
jgi:hypothetical protein